MANDYDWDGMGSDGMVWYGELVIEFSAEL